MLLLPSTCSSLINRYQIPVPERLSVQLVGERVCSKIRQRESIQTRQYRSSGMFYQYNGGWKRSPVWLFTLFQTGDRHRWNNACGNCCNVNCKADQENTSNRSKTPGHISHDNIQMRLSNTPGFEKPRNFPSWIAQQLTLARPIHGGRNSRHGKLHPSTPSCN